MEVRAYHRGDGTYRVEGSLSGASVVVDTRSRPESGREAAGPRPTELVLFGAATCPAVDLLDILEKMRHPADDLIVEVHGERADSHPRRFLKVHIHFRIQGRGIPEAKARRAVRLAVERYCSVTASLNAQVTWDVAVEPPEAQN